MTGADGTTDATVAPGPGPCGSHSSIAGGVGGTTTVMAASAGVSEPGDPSSAGGGGGAVGRLRIATKDGTFDASTAVLSAAITMDQLVAK